MAGQRNAPGAQYSARGRGCLHGQWGIPELPQNAYSRHPSRWQVMPESGAVNFHRERGDDYRGELYRFGRWRVALCRDRLQYLLQRRRRPKSGAGVAWDNLAYCVTRTALLRRWRLETGDGGEALERLPDRAPLLDLAEWRAQVPLPHGVPVSNVAPS